jgi:hypothetical protein
MKKTMWLAVIFLAVLCSLCAAGLIAQADSSGLPQVINVYRASVGVSPLTEVAALDTSAQGGSDNSCAQGLYLLPTPPLSGSWTIWQVYGYNTAEEVLAAELTDPSIAATIASPTANAIGVGVNRSCGNLGNLWTIELGHANVLPTEPTPTLPSSTGTVTLSPTPLPAGDTPTATPTSPPTPTTSATPIPTCMLTNIQCAPITECVPTVPPYFISGAGHAFCYCGHDGPNGRAALCEVLNPPPLTVGDALNILKAVAGLPY